MKSIIILVLFALTMTSSTPVKRNGTGLEGYRITSTSPLQHKVGSQYRPYPTPCDGNIWSPCDIAEDIIPAP